MRSSDKLPAWKRRYRNEVRWALSTACLIGSVVATIAGIIQSDDQSICTGGVLFLCYSIAVAI